VTELVLGSHRLAVGVRTLVMGIVNANPDSFYDQGRHAGTERAVARGRALIEQGADIVDVGGQTGQRGDQVPVEVEIDRIRPVVEQLATLGVPVSVDTYRAEVADAVLAVGAVLVNDYTGFFDPELPSVAARRGAGVVCAHYRGAPRSNPSRSYAVSVDEVERELGLRREQALAAGVAEDAILVDPCFGFGKDTASDVALVAAMPRLRALGAPLLAACSHKEFTADATGLDEHDLRGTIAAAVLCARAGADVLRLHDVGELVPVLRLADAVREAATVGERTCTSS
jgi:dihydropteroate synthase